MATRTTNLNLYKPVVGGDTDNWGGFLNNNAAYIDALFTKSGAAVTLHVKNQQIDGTSSYLFDSVKFDDNRKALFGTGLDLEIYHDGSNSFVGDVGTGDLYVFGQNNIYLANNASGSENYLTATKDGAVSLFYDNAAKLATASGGVNITGSLNILAEGDLRLQDASGGEYVGFDAPATVSGSYTLTLPAAVGSSGQILRTSDGSGTLEWVTDQEGDLKSVADATNGGLTVTNGTGPDVTLALNFNDLSAAAVSVANDSIAIIDASDSNGTRKESIADLATGMGGTGLTGSSGTLNVDAAQTQITSVGALNAGSITSGFGAIDVGSSAISGGAGTLSSLSVGDGNITNVGDIALDSISSDGSAIAIGGTGDTVTCNGAWIFNESSADVDFRIEGNGEANLFFVDAGNDRIGINTNAPTAKLHLLQSAADFDSGIKLVGSDSVISGRIWMGGGHLHVDNATAGTGTGLTLEDGGNVGVGVDAPHAKLTVKDATNISMDSSGSGQLAVTGNGYTGAIALDSGYMNIYHNSNSAGIAFGTNETGRMYIDSAGIVTIGRTSGQAFTVTGHQFYQSGGYYNAHAAGEVVRWYESGSGNDVGSIDTTSSSTAYNTSSDRRLKENIEAADASGSLIDDIEIVKHDWIASDDYVRYGVIAQDLFEVVPEAVSRGTDGDLVDDDVSDSEMPTKQVWGVDYSKLVPLLIKEVQDLRSRVAELEA